MTSPQTIAPGADPTGAPRLRVLVVDDDPHINGLLQIRLSARGYDVASASSGDEALARLDEIRPDLMLLDVSMPGLNGLDVLERVRADGRDIAVIMTTAFGSELVAIDALRRGADDYLRKPFEPEEFRAVVERTASRLQLRRQNAELRRQLKEQHRQLEAELARAAGVQAALLPDAVPILPGFDLAACCLPAREVGGDFFDWSQDRDKVRLSLGDVMGKGMPAALLMATVRAALRSVTHLPVPDAVTVVNRALAPDLERSDAFITLFHAEVDLPTGIVAFADAGHGLAMVLRRGGSAQPLRQKGLPLGILPNAQYAAGATQLDKGETLVVYSDGLPDARPDLVLDPTGIATWCAGLADAHAMLDRLVAVADGGGPRPDDLTVLLVRRQDHDR